MCLHSKRWVGSAVSELFTPVFHLEWQKKHKQTHTEVKFESYAFGSLGTPTIDVFWFARNRKWFCGLKVYIVPDICSQCLELVVIEDRVSTQCVYLALFAGGNVGVSIFVNWYMLLNSCPLPRYYKTYSKRIVSQHRSEALKILGREFFSPK